MQMSVRRFSAIPHLREEFTVKCHLPLVGELLNQHIKKLTEINWFQVKFRTKNRPCHSLQNARGSGH